MNYGAPYLGSKSKIARFIVNHLPAGTRLVEPFMGGGAITHCALLSGKWKEIVSSDITDSPIVFEKAVNGEYSKPEYLRWISREEFFASDDIAMKMVWSFGNTLKKYIYGKAIEQKKKALHFAVCWGDFSLADNLFGLEIAEALRGVLDGLKGVSARRKAANRFVKKIGTRCDLQHLERLERLQRLEGLERLQQLEGLSLRARTDYASIEIRNGDIVYCDPPYRGTEKYLHQFDHARFWDWAREVSKRAIVVVSEYRAPDDFVCILSLNKICTLSDSSNSVKTVERLFVHRDYCKGEKNA